VNRLLTDLHSAKAQAEDVITQLQHMHTELSGVREEARSELAEEARWRTQLQQDLVDLKAELQGAQQEPAHMHSPGPLLLVQEGETLTWRAQTRTGSGRDQSSHADTLSSRTRGADAPAKRPRDSDSAAEVDARRSFVALYAPSVVGTEWTELVLPGGSSVVPAAVFNCPAPEGPQEQWVQMALYGGAFVFGVLADVLEAKNARECKGKADVPESAHQKQPNRKNTWQRFAAARTDKKSTGKASSLDGNVFYLPSESDPCGGQGVGDRGPAAALINMSGVRALLKVTITLSTLSLSLSGAM
jgi:hypothetical protein